jgi:hypothetical protein
MQPIHPANRTSGVIVKVSSYGRSQALLVGGWQKRCPRIKANSFQLHSILSHPEGVYCRVAYPRPSPARLSLSSDFKKTQ